MPVRAHEPLTGALRVTGAAVMVPPAPLVPVAVMQLPGGDVGDRPGVGLGDRGGGRVGDRRVAVRVAEDECRTVDLHQLTEGGVAAQARDAAPAEGEGALVEPPLAAALPHATTARPAMTPATPRMARFMRWFLLTG